MKTEPHINDPTMQAQIRAELGRLPWAKDLSRETIDDLAATFQVVSLEAGEVVHRCDQSLTSAVFVIRGRLHATVKDLFGNDAFKHVLIRGTAFGMFSIAQPDDVNTDVVALEPSTILKLPLATLFDLGGKHRDLQMSLYRLAGQLVRRVVMVDRTKALPSAVGIVHQSPATREFTSRLLGRLSQIEDGLCLASDDSDWQSIEGVNFRSIYKDGRLISTDEGRELLVEWSALGRVFLDLGAHYPQSELIRLVRFADRILWCVEPQEIEPALSLIKSIEQSVPNWRDKISLVWVLEGDAQWRPFVPGLSEIVEGEFKISFQEPGPNQGGLLRSGLERIVHDLRGCKIGLALGGGAARGMAHLGVLKALEDHGIHVDMIAGTSAGAMTGVVYASGIAVEHAIDLFKTDLTLPWHFRRMPGGGYWYLVYKYRRGQFDPMLRKYLEDARLEQLPIPMLTVTVDLVRGGPVIREQGDATRCILESINLPGLSKPIINQGEALVDGGLVNNIPADVLVAKGCNFVLASSVTAKLEREFAGIRADQPVERYASPSFLQVMMRGQAVQNFNMNAVGVQPADFVIEPDVTSFDLSEFERTDELAEVGERTANESITQIKQLLAKLDSKLFSD